MTAAAVPVRSARVPFRLAGGAQPLILLPVHINGRGPFDFIFDTGAGTSLLTPELAKEVNVEIIGSKEGQTPGGKVAVSLGRASSLAVGGLQFKDVDIGIVDLAHIGATVGARIDGDLGYNFLRHFRVTIDYANGEIYFDYPQRAEGGNEPAKAEVPIRLANPAKPLILVDVYANGRGPFPFAIDTGTSTTAITPHLAKELALLTTPMGAGTTAGAQVKVNTGSLQSFQLGGAKIENMVVVVADFFDMLSKAIGAELAGIVGYNFLRHYKVVLDYPNQTLKLL